MQKRLEPLQFNQANALGYRDEYSGNGEGLGQHQDAHREDNTAPAPQQHPAPAGLLEAGVRPRHRDTPRPGRNRCQKRHHRPGTWWSDGVKAAESSAGPRGLPAAGGGLGHTEEALEVRLTCARCALAAHNPLWRIWTPPAPPQARQQHEPTWKGFGAVRPLAPDPLG